MARLVELVIGGSAEPWKNIGLTVDDNRVRIADVDIVCEPMAPGLHSWRFAADRDAHFSLDGIPTTLVSSTPAASFASRMCGRTVVALDHVVINTDDLERTCAVIERELSAPLRRIRDAGRGMRQGFHRLDNTVIEVVSTPNMNVDGATLWGFVPVVDDLEAIAAHLGPDVLSAPKPAVQEGRSIATVRAAVGLGVPLAVMTPHVG